MNDLVQIAAGLAATLVISGLIFSLVMCSRPPNPFKAPVYDGDDQAPPMTQLEACYLTTYQAPSPTRLAVRKYRELMKRKI